MYENLVKYTLTFSPVAGNMEKRREVSPAIRERLERGVIHHQNTYADVVSNVLATWNERKFPPGTKFLKLKRGEKFYWYADFSGKRKYLGKDTPELESAVLRENTVAGMDREVKAMVSELRRAGMPVPGNIIGDTIASIAWNGFFRLRGVLVGTLAFQTYLPMFGESPVDFFDRALREFGLTASVGMASRTMDVDIDRFHSISLAVDDSLDKPLSEILGPEFSQIPSVIPGVDLPKWRNAKNGLTVDLLAPLRTPMDKEFVFLPSIGASAIKLKFLDFLVYDEIPAVVLHGNGIPVNVPRPERYAVHKLIICNERKNPVKAEKDIVQGIALCGYLLQNHAQALRDAFSEAAERGPGWRRRLAASFSNRAMPEKLRQEFFPLIEAPSSSFGPK